MTTKKKNSGENPPRAHKRKKMKFVFVILAWFSLYQFSVAQISRTGVPFLLISSSPETNSLGGISTLARVDDPLALYGNAGLLGLQSLNHNFSASTYAQKTLWLPPFKLPDLTYVAWAVGAGIDLSRFMEIPFPVGLGVGFTKTRIDLGKFARTGNDPIVISTFDAFEQSKTFYVGIGFEHFVRGGFGVGFKNIESNVVPFGTASEPQTGPVNASARDWGAVIEVPFGSLISEVGLVPVLNLNLGAGVRNIGEEIKYPPSQEKDPLPREAHFGLGGEFGYRLNGPQGSLTLLSLTIARQASDILVKTKPVGGFEYESGFGDISVWNNVIRGDASDRVESRKAWQLNLLDIFFLRRGSFVGVGYRHTSTSGFGFKLNPLLNIVRIVSEPLASSKIFVFFAEHIDIQYNYGEYTDDSPLAGTTFHGLVLKVK